MEQFYFRLYSGHKGKFGHEFEEFEFTNQGLFRYTNNSGAREEAMIRNEMYVSPGVLQEITRMVEVSELTEPDIKLFPKENSRKGKVVVDMYIGDNLVQIETPRIDSLEHIGGNWREQGESLYYLIHDIRTLGLTLMRCHNRDRSGQPPQQHSVMKNAHRPPQTRQLEYSFSAKSNANTTPLYTRLGPISTGSTSEVKLTPPAPINDNILLDWSLEFNSEVQLNAAYNKRLEALGQWKAKAKRLLDEKSAKATSNKRPKGELRPESVTTSVPLDNKHLDLNK